MKRIPLFLVLTLALAWWCTSWYWYTCNIKWACQQSYQSDETLADIEPVITTNQENIETVNDREVWSNSNTSQEVQSLSRWDVLVWNAVIPQAPVEQEETQSQEELAAQEETSSEALESETTASWSLNQEDEDTLEQESALESDLAAETDLCVSPLVGPISSGGANNPSDVAKLERFLIANAYLWSSDWVYGNADFEAVKQLQLDYKTQMLDPWGIDTPTGYVWKTTVATINSIWCKN